ncbi:ketosynthase chain-length factor [Actinoplanes derwentensis]|uniref:Act minimal PKS chain-length factor (CLF/KS beta) n=1 Tax=Actinoplanes derwentensis TaxID=113562 RepID=A0A1H2D8U0_9ACTN|nr:ketosynthase chain-length factor [Actinoplanes derwentensis]GID89709.1 actinorhodin polyketide putative beta-ketoacyl synthase 2 [Actinoplanes derwentensis]SDT78882.1 act minimal PKS chain-length factor (CLF/KS beta) [Actinoplanes derwentensis]
MTAPVVTGLGVVAANGLGTEAYWQATLNGRTGVRTISRFDPAGYPVRLAGEVPDFVAEEHLPGRLLPQTDRMTRLSLYAAEQALADAGVPDTDGLRYDVGVATASSMGGFEFGQRELGNLWSKGGSHVSAYQSFAWFYAVNSGQISIRHNLRGPGAALVTDHAGGLDALGHARRQIRRGTASMLTGAVDGALCPLGLAGLLSTGVYSTGTDPGTAYRPFAADADGAVPGEGGAHLILEEKDAARARGARVYGELSGYAATFDPSGAAPTGLRRAITGALRDARAEPGDVDLVIADATADRAADRAEAAALAEVFGPRAVPVTAPKTLVGRLQAGAAALDVATALLALRDGVAPHTATVDTPAPDYPIDLVTGAPRTLPLRRVLVVARGRGGFNAAAVLRRV